jgi:hypothetical protein
MPTFTAITKTPEKNVGQPFQADKTREEVRLESLTYIKLGDCPQPAGAANFGLSERQWPIQLGVNNL